MKYLDAIQQPANPQSVAHMTKGEIESSIAQIGELLKGRMSNTERAMLVLDCKDLRAQLAKLTA